MYKKDPLSKVKYPLTLLIFFLVLNLFASDNPITGTILDYETKEPLPYASIIVVKNHSGTVSNSEGNFMLDMEGINPGDTIIFHYMGYKTLKIIASELQKITTVYLYPAAVNLREVQVLSRKLTPEEIIELAYKNFDKNQSASPDKRSVFVHKYEKVPFQKESKLVMKESNFVGLNKKTFDELLKKIPREFVEYQDAIGELYSNGDNDYKLVPVKAISLEEGSQEALIKEFENKLGDFFADIEKSMGEKDIYYKVRTGILSQKLGNKKKDKEYWSNRKDKEEDKDTLNYTIETADAKDYLHSLLNSYTKVECSNWEFINYPNKYNYTTEDVLVYNDELVYKISFTPKKRGLFEGTVYISTNSYAILQLDFAYAEGKKSESIKLFGFSHATNYREAHIIFEKGPSGYFVKYLYTRKREFSSIDRDFSVMKKQKRFFIDKELSEMKFEAQLAFNLETHWEMLVLERNEITPDQYEKIKEPTNMKFKKEYAYTPEMWENRTVIVPAAELQKYKRR